MANYNIVLNLSGNAVSRAEKLARALARADVSAKSLAVSLRALGSAAQTIPTRTIRVSEARSTGRPVSDTGVYTRHKHSRVGSYGYGFSIGGFSARLSTILQPDENGNILGINAAKLSKALNISGLVMSVASVVGKGLIKAVATTTFANYAIGGLGTMFMTRLLMSEGMSEGVRIIQRRNQAKLGLGESFLQAQQNADLLAQNYGLDRSQAISAINVLSGLKVAKTGEKLSLSDATYLTRVGGLLSQQAGVSFERVMTNLQQILVQSNPNLRDIRELLNQAPILGRYALDEMEKRGITGVDKNTYLKDSSNLLSVLTRYDLENMSSPVMQARGMITVAQQDFFAKLAENRSWVQIAGNAANLLNSLGDALSKFITSITSNSRFQNSILSLSNLFDLLARNSDSIVKIIDKLSAKIYGLLGIDVDGVDEREQSQRMTTIRTVADRYSPDLFKIFVSSGYSRSKDPEIQKKEFETFLLRAVTDWTWDPEKRASVQMKYPAEYAGFDPNMIVHNANLARWKTANKELNSIRADSVDFRSFYMPAGSKPYVGSTPEFHSFMSILGYETLKKWFTSDLEKMRNGQAGGFSVGGAGGSGTTGTEDDLSGFSRDRRSLVINFNDKLIEWNSSIVTDDPKEVENDVAQNLNEIISAAVQKALLGATNTMNSRWY